MRAARANLSAYLASAQKSSGLGGAAAGAGPMATVELLPGASSKRHASLPAKLSVPVSSLHSSLLDSSKVDSANRAAVPELTGARVQRRFLAIEELPPSDLSLVSEVRESHHRLR